MFSFFKWVSDELSKRKPQVTEEEVAQRAEREFNQKMWVEKSYEFPNLDELHVIYDNNRGKLPEYRILDIKLLSGRDWHSNNSIAFVPYFVLDELDEGVNTKDLLCDFETDNILCGTVRHFEQSQSTTEYDEETDVFAFDLIATKDSDELSELLFSVPLSTNFVKLHYVHQRYLVLGCENRAIVIELPSSAEIKKEELDKEESLRIAIEIADSYSSK